jgi:hypothetical protein
VRRGAIALSLATLFFGRQIASWSVAENRYLYHWQRADSLWLIAGVLAAALLAFGVAAAVGRLGGPRARRALRLAFALALGQVLVGLVLAPDAEKPFEGAALAAFAAAGLTLYGFRRSEARVAQMAATAALVAFPLAPILFLQILGWKSWRECAAPAPVAALAGAGSGPPVYILLFDEWSLARSERDGEFLPELVNLRRLAARGTVYREARSAGDATQQSIPRLLFGENGEIVPGNGRAMWQVGDSAWAATSRANLFRQARASGYRTELAGWYLPYAALVGDDLDACRAWPQVPKREGPARLLDLLWANLRHLPDPLSRAVWRAIHSRRFSENWFALNRRIEREAMRLAREGPAQLLAFVHFPLPHAPFIFEADGRYAGPFENGRMFGTVEEYARQVRYLDVVLGRFLDTLEAAGRLDSAVVIVTSDHSWKKDPDKRERERDRLRRVPLVVKGPGVVGGTVKADGYCLPALRDLIGLVAVAERAYDCTVP